MKILLINGSPRGQESTFSMMLSAFVKDITDSCEIVPVNLSEKRIYSCKRCYSCWKSAEGCVLEDNL